MDIDVHIIDSTGSSRKAMVTQNNEVLVDSHSIDSSHHEIHEGESFTAFITDDSLAMNNKISLAFKVPNVDRTPHLIIEADTSGIASIFLYRDATWPGDDGSETTKIIHSRNQEIKRKSNLLENETSGGSSWDANNKLVAFPEAVALAKHPTGTEIDHFHTSSGKREGTNARAIAEWVLARDTVWAVVLESEASSNNCILKLHWYEHSLVDDFRI